MTDPATPLAPRAVSPQVLALRDALRQGRMRRRGTMPLGDLAIEVIETADSVFALVRRPHGGGLALRLAWAGGAPLRCGRLRTGRRRNGPAPSTARLTITSAIGKHEVALVADPSAPQRLQALVTLTPACDLALPYAPRDLIALGDDDDPLAARGAVLASQRGVNTGLVYFEQTAPAFGSVLYVQDLTRLNPYFTATDTVPDGVVGGAWPELGLRLPTPADPPAAHRILRAQVPVVISAATLAIRGEAGDGETASARRFVQLMGEIYAVLDKPPCDYRDWPARAARTAHDLATSPKATIRHYGRRYAHPYTASEYPDSMVQLSLLAALRDWDRWRGETTPLADEFAAGLHKFYDARLGCSRRYLPNVGSDKNANAVDSWYLYHPLGNLASLALGGDAGARDLFFKSIDFGIRAARHFDYRWPIQYDVTDFSVIAKVAPADGRGQTDVGGLYAWVMLQAYELTGDARFIAEAEAALAAARNMRFALNYQANLTAWGAAACLRLWRITNAEQHREQAYVYLASFLHNCALWESEIRGARLTRNFMGATCLQDAPYMAIYECFDSFMAFEHCLRDAGPALDPAARDLLSEYCRYALDRAWFYYPDVLPSSLLATTIRNGHIDPALSFPLEDLYIDGQNAGQVGQEIYGAGAAFIFASRTVHHLDDAPFQLSCDHFIMASERPSANSFAFTLDGAVYARAALNLTALDTQPLPRFRLLDESGKPLRPTITTASRTAFAPLAQGRYVLNWR